MSQTPHWQNGIDPRHLDVLFSVWMDRWVWDSDKTTHGWWVLGQLVHIISSLLSAHCNYSFCPWFKEKHLFLTYLPPPQLTKERKTPKYFLQLSLKQLDIVVVCNRIEIQGTQSYISQILASLCFSVNRVWEKSPKCVAQEHSTYKALKYEYIFTVLCTSDINYISFQCLALW